jgi:decaprenylphospho-beta-D-erythro-pentofuranosid-2-ulose 2-reductase
MMAKPARSQRVVILGALSAIGEATARLYAAEGARLALAGRNAVRLNQVAADLILRGSAHCDVHVLDLADCDATAEFPRMTAALGGLIDAVFLFYGVLGDQHADECDLARQRRILNVNFNSAVEWCAVAADLLEQQNHGVLVAVTSVAGDRGRRSNYIYGASKAGLTTFVEGVAHRLAPTKARAVAAKVGFVDTPMTAHVAKETPIWAQPETVARRLKAAADRPSAPVIYAPWFWRFIMLAVRLTPAFIFHRTRL